MAVIGTGVLLLYFYFRLIGQQFAERYQDIIVLKGKKLGNREAVLPLPNLQNLGRFK